jgi:hypothetical protein
LLAVDDRKDATRFFRKVDRRNGNVQEERFDELALACAIPTIAALVTGAKVQRTRGVERRYVE